MHERADRLQVEYWWSLWPEANVAIATGSVSDLAVIDVDPRNGGEETLGGLEAIRGPLPPTLQSRTGGGGRHLWFTTGGRHLTTAELGPGLEMKAERGLIVAPPSRHHSGEVYRWVGPTHEPVPLPDWVEQTAYHMDRVPGPQTESPPRSPHEQEEFRELWLQAGIDLAPGDGYYLCPFHDDHHPSLHIDAEGCRWYCFACHTGGGIGRLSRRMGLSRHRVPRERLRGHVGRDRAITLSGDERVAVVGESFHQDALLLLAGGERSYGGVDLETVAELVPVEGDGIEVRVDDNLVGFLGEEDAERLADPVADTVDLEGAATCRAAVRGGWDRGGGDIGLFGVTLFLPACDATD
jgi:hypothetical protein